MLKLPFKALGLTSVLVTATFAQAATIQFSYDAVQISTSSAFPNTSATTTVAINQALPAITVPQGSFFRFGVAAVVSNNGNAAAGGSFESANGVAQPTTLGIGNIPFVITDSASAFATPRVVSNKSTAAFIAPFTATEKGNVNTVNGTVGDTLPLGGGVLAGNVDAGNSADLSKLVIGTSGSPSIFTSLAYSTPAAGVTAITPSVLTGTNQLQFVVNTLIGDADNAPKYGVRNYSALTDSFNLLAPLSVTITPVPEPTSLALLGLTAVGALRRRRA